MFKALCYQAGGTTYTLQITEVFYIPLTPWCGPLQSCVQGTVLSDRRHYLHTADNRCILHTSNTLVGPLQSCVQGTVLSGRRCILHTSNTLVGLIQSCARHCVITGGTTYTLQITDVFYIPLTPWCGPLQSCVQGTVLSGRRHYLHTADNRCTTYTLQITDVFYIPLTPWLDRSNHVFKALCYQAGGTTYTLQITDVFYIPLTPWCGPLQSCVQGTVLSGRRHYLHTADNRCILHTCKPWCGPLQSCVQGTVLSGRRHYLHTADNRCILHTSNTLVRTAPIMCSRHCVIRQEALLTHCR